MKICPICKNEYRDGITHCAECGVELVEEGSEKQVLKLLMEAEYPIIQRITKYLEYCKFNTLSVDEPDEDGFVRLSCSEKEYKEAFKQMNVFVMEENKKAAQAVLDELTEDDIKQMEEEAKQAPPSNIYVNYQNKADENKSSAWSFLVLGILGVGIVALSWFDMLPFSIGGSGNWFTHGVMLAFFIVFIIIGVVSAGNVNKYKLLAGQEADAQSELEQYLAETFPLEVLSEITAESEEEAYFNRMKYMREHVGEAFEAMSSNGEFVESLLDAHYDKLFG